MKKKNFKKKEAGVTFIRYGLLLIIFSVAIFSLSLSLKESQPFPAQKPIQESQSESIHASLPYLKGGDIKMTFSDTPTLGKTSQVTVTFTPFFNGSDCHATFRAGLGIEFSGEGIMIHDENPYLDLTDKKKIQLEKGKPLTFVFNIKPVRPGVWNVGFTFSYEAWRSSGLHYAEASDSYNLVITEEGTQIYNIRDKVPAEEACWVASEIRLFTLDRKGKTEGVTAEDKYIAYLLKEPRLDFEPTYQFEVDYSTSCSPPLTPEEKGLPREERAVVHQKVRKEKTKKPKGSLVWSVVGNIGTIDENGVFTATHFGKGKIRVEHGQWLFDEIDIQVISHPKPSPADKIVEVIVVPYETEEEKAFVNQVLDEYKNKKFKSKKEVHESLNPKGAFKAKYFEKSFNKEIKRVADELVLQEGTTKTFIALPVKAIGQITARSQQSDIHYAYADAYDCLEKGMFSSYNEIVLNSLTFSVLTLVGKKESSCIIGSNICHKNSCYTSSRYKVKVSP